MYDVLVPVKEASDPIDADRLAIYRLSEISDLGSSQESPFGGVAVDFVEQDVFSFGREQPGSTHNVGG